MLAHRAGGASGLPRLYALPDARTDWRETFQTALDITLDDFRAMHENHRSAGFPELVVPDFSP